MDPAALEYLRKKESLIYLVQLVLEFMTCIISFGVKKKNHIP